MLYSYLYCTFSKNMNIDTLLNEIIGVRIWTFVVAIITLISMILDYQEEKYIRSIIYGCISIYLFMIVAQLPEIIINWVMIILGAVVMIYISYKKI